MMRRLRLGDVVKSVRRLDSSTRAMAAGTSRRAPTEGVADAPVTTAQTAELTVHGTLDGTSSTLAGRFARMARPLAPIGLESPDLHGAPHFKAGARTRRSGRARRGSSGSARASAGARPGRG